MPSTELICRNVHPLYSLDRVVAGAHNRVKLRAFIFAQFPLAVPLHGSCGYSVRLAFACLRRGGAGGQQEYTRTAKSVTRLCIFLCLGKELFEQAILLGFMDDVADGERVVRELDRLLHIRLAESTAQFNRAKALLLQQQELFSRLFKTPYRKNIREPAFGFKAGRMLFRLVMAAHQYKRKFLLHGIFPNLLNLLRNLTGGITARPSKKPPGLYPQTKIKGYTS
jgi:hypothetical protein